MEVDGGRMPLAEEVLGEGQRRLTRDSQTWREQNRLALVKKKSPRMSSQGSKQAVHSEIGSCLTVRSAVAARRKSKASFVGLRQRPISSKSSKAGV